MVGSSSFLYRKTTFLGIEWAPLVVPLRRRLQTLVVGATICILLYGEICLLAAYFWLMYTSLAWWAVCLYTVYMLLDIGVENRGGRRYEWVRNLNWWSYIFDFFPLKVVKTADLDPSRNYILACYPHGVISFAPLLTFGTNGLHFKRTFPGLKPYMITLPLHFSCPFYREFFLALGLISSSEESIKYVLDPGRNKGTCLGMCVGGVSEILWSNPGQHKIVLKKRKGFIRVALQTGSPIVPVYAFGETDLYRQPANPEGSLLRTVQERVKKLIFLAPVLPMGRGIFQYTFGPLPQRRPLTMVVGEPIDVQRVLEPTPAQIDELHQLFTRRLTTLFETEKRKYIHNYQNVHLEIV